MARERVCVLEWHGPAVVAAARAAAQREGDKRMEAVLTESKDNRVPVLSGDLMRSGRVENPEPVTWDIVFGGGDVPYALRQHEEHKSKHHFLLSPFLEMVPAALKSIERAVRIDLKGRP